MRLFSRSNIYILVHIFCWLILTLGVLYSHPPEWGDKVPKEFYTRQNVLLAVLLGAFYLFAAHSPIAFKRENCLVCADNICNCSKRHFTNKFYK